MTGSGFGFVMTSSDPLSNPSQSNLDQSNLYQSNLGPSSHHVTCLFGRANASAIVVSASQITCVAPASTRYTPTHTPHPHTPQSNTISHILSPLTLPHPHIHHLFLSTTSIIIYILSHPQLHISHFSYSRCILSGCCILFR